MNISQAMKKEFSENKSGSLAALMAKIENKAYLTVNSKGNNKEKASVNAAPARVKNRKAGIAAVAACAVLAVGALAFGGIIGRDGIDTSSVEYGEDEYVKTQSVMRDFASYPDWQALIDNSTDIVKGLVRERRYALYDGETGETVTSFKDMSEKEILESYEVCTIYTVYVEGAFKGDLRGGDHIISVRTFGGIINGVKYDYQTGMNIQKDDECLFFLNKEKQFDYYLSAELQSAYVYDRQENRYYPAANGMSFEQNVNDEYGYITMPDLSGKSPEEAENTLKELGANVVFREAFDTQPESTVIKTEPAAGSLFNAGDTVTVFISRGSAGYGKYIGMNADEAKTALEKEGKKTEIRYAASGSPEDEVVSVQDGYDMDGNTIAVLYVSDGNAAAFEAENAADRETVLSYMTDYESGTSDSFDEAEFVKTVKVFSGNAVRDEQGELAGIDISFIGISEKDNGDIDLYYKIKTKDELDVDLSVLDDGVYPTVAASAGEFSEVYPGKILNCTSYGIGKIALRDCLIENQEHKPYFKIAFSEIGSYAGGKGDYSAQINLFGRADNADRRIDELKDSSDLDLILDTLNSKAEEFGIASAENCGSYLDVTANSDNSATKVKAYLEAYGVNVDLVDIHTSYPTPSGELPVSETPITSPYSVKKLVEQLSNMDYQPKFTSCGVYEKGTVCEIGVLYEHNIAEMEELLKKCNVDMSAVRVVVNGIAENVIGFDRSTPLEALYGKKDEYHLNSIEYLHPEGTTSIDILRIDLADTDKLGSLSEYITSHFKEDMLYAAPISINGGDYHFYETAGSPKKFSIESDNSVISNDGKLSGSFDYTMKDGVLTFEITYTNNSGKDLTNGSARPYVLFFGDGKGEGVNYEPAIGEVFELKAGETKTYTYTYALGVNAQAYGLEGCTTARVEIRLQAFGYNYDSDEAFVFNIEL